MSNVKSKVSGKVVYIAGPMAGKKDLNRAAFNEMERKLAKLGAKTVYNPVRLAAFAFDGTRGMTREEIMRQDVSDLMHCDVAVFLPGWNRSRGAKLEHELAEQLGIPVLEA